MSISKEASVEASKKIEPAVVETEVKAASSSESKQGEESVSEENRIFDSPDKESTDDDMSE